MKIKEKKIILFRFLVHAAETAGVLMGQATVLNDDDEREAILKCELEDKGELRFFVNALGDEGLLATEHTLSNIGYRITMAGYEFAERLAERS